MITIKFEYEDEKRLVVVVETHFNSSNISTSKFLKYLV